MRVASGKGDKDKWMERGTEDTERKECERKRRTESKVKKLRECEVGRKE